MAFPIAIQAMQALQEQCQAVYQETGRVPERCGGVPVQGEPEDSAIMSEIGEEQARIQRQIEIQQEIQERMREIANPRRPASPEPARPLRGGAGGSADRVPADAYTMVGIRSRPAK